MENISTVILITFGIVIGLMIIGMTTLIIKKLLKDRDRYIITSNPL